MDKYPKYISEEQQERFERYLLGELTDEERKTFEREVLKDPELRDQFEEFKALFETIEEAGMRAQLDTFHQALEEAKTPVRQLEPVGRKFNYRIAASVAILLAFGGLWFFNRLDPNEQLFREYYSPDPGLPTVMGSNDNYAFYEAMVDYKQGKYDVAISKWEKLLAQKPENDTLNYFLGSAHLANGNTQRSLPYLENVSQNNRSRFYQESLYYLGLNYLKLGRNEDAERVLGQGTSTKGQQLKEKLNPSE